MTASNSYQEEPKVGYLFGYPIKHSLSPLVHNTVFRHLSLSNIYTFYESKDIEAFLRLTASRSFYGSAVTMPHKVSIIPHLDALTPAGAAIGAINTIFVQNDAHGKRRLVGTNTDCIGIHQALVKNMSAADLKACADAPALIIGGGGTARAAVYALKKLLGCGRIYILNRDVEEVAAVMSECSAKGFGAEIVHVRSVEQARSLPAPRVIVAAIPDFEPVTDGERRVRECLTLFLERERGTILEMCYHPRPQTAIARLAERKRWNLVLGTEAMVWQALEQDRYWTGREVKDLPVEKVRALIKEAVEKSATHL